MTAPEYKKSKLLPVGVVLIAIGLLAPFPVEALAHAIQPEDNTNATGLLLSGTLLIGSDLLRVLFFAGIACAIIGGLRNRNARKAAIGKTAG
jgi:hypothetical protein